MHRSCLIGMVCDTVQLQSQFAQYPIGLNLDSSNLQTMLLAADAESTEAAGCTSTTKHLSNYVGSGSPSIGHQNTCATQLACPQGERTQPEHVDFHKHPSGIIPKLQNVVSTCSVGRSLDLKFIAMHARNAEYNPKRFSAVIMRIREPKTTALIFSSGESQALSCYHVVNYITCGNRIGLGRFISNH